MEDQLKSLKVTRLKELKGSMAFNFLTIKPFNLILLTSIIFHLSSIPAWAVEMKFNGQARLRFFYTNNLSDAHSGKEKVCPNLDGDLNQTCDDQEIFKDAQFRLKMTAAKGITTGVAVVDFLSQKDDENVATLSPSDQTIHTGNWRLGSEGFGGGLDSIVLREGYLRATFPALSVIIGRQGIHLGHGLILDDTADALVVAIPAGSVGFTLGDIKLVESESLLNGNGDTEIYFAHMAWVPQPNAVMELFLIRLQDRGPNLTFNGVCKDPNDTPPASQSCEIKEDLGGDLMRLFVVGWTLNTKADRYHLGFEADHLTGRIVKAGEDIRLRGFNSLIKIKIPWPVAQIRLTGVYASGQKINDIGNKLNINAISPNFVLGNILVNNEFNSDRDGGNIGGLTAIRLAAERPLQGDFHGELALIWARLTQRPALDIDQDLGWEIDFNTTYPFDDHLLWKADFGILLTGEGWQGIYGDPEADNHQIKLSTRLVYTF